MNLMVAVRRFRFADVNLEPGETFYARPAMAASLKKLGRAKDAPDETRAAVYQRRDMRAEQAPVTVSIIDDLRAQYEVKFGRKPDRRWKETRLRQELI